MKAQADEMKRKQRNSNLELYRIVCMLMIVAHHYVVNSGLTDDNGPIMTEPASVKSLFLLLFGGWGKTGINCFLMITGYYMCKSQISLRKFVKLYCQILFYNIVIYVAFYLAAREPFHLSNLVPALLPFWGFKDGFTSCFLVFYLLIPFWNILINSMMERQHQLLLIISLTCYTLLGSIPKFGITYNYITWFGIIYLIASYIRLYPRPIFEKTFLWGIITLIMLLISMVSIVVMQISFHKGYFFVEDCNKIFAVLVSVSSFLWFKSLNIRYSKLINTIGAGTFGVLLIHANSDAMRTWLWYDVVDSLGHYSLPLYCLVIYSIVSVLLIFFVCNLIDQLRIATIERWMLYVYDWKFAEKDNFSTK